jgi:hypothetical protein
MIEYVSSAISNYFYPTNKNTKLDDVTLLAIFALMPTYSRGTRIGVISHHQVAIQESYKYIDAEVPVIGEVVLNSQSMTRRYNGNGRSEACIFHKTITSGIEQNKLRTDYHKLCHLAQEGFIEYIRPYEDDEDNASIVFDITRKALVNYDNNVIKKPQSFDEKSGQKWDDEQLNTLVNLIQTAKNEDKAKGIRPARDAVITYLATKHLELEPKLKEELKLSQKV